MVVGACGASCVCVACASARAQRSGVGRYRDYCYTVDMPLVLESADAQQVARRVTHRVACGPVGRQAIRK